METLKTEDGHLSRRRFLTGMVGAGLAIPFISAFGTERADSRSEHLPIAFFTKPLDGYEAAFMAETLAMAGITGFDLSVRPGGRVEPERIEDELPGIIETGKKYGLVTEMMVSSVKTADDASEKVLRISARHGIRHYRLGYYNYDFSAGIRESLYRLKSDLAPLAQLNGELGIQAGYQNHSGNRVGAPVWDVWELVSGFPVQQVSAQYDIRHAVTEGALSWPLGLRLLGKNIGSLAIKDFTWEVRNRKAQIVSVPLGEGIVDFTQFFSLLRELNIHAPLTLHVEYPLLGKAEESLPLLQQQKIMVTKLKKDVDFVRRHINAS